MATLPREELILQLNTAPLLPAAVSVRPTPEIINNENNVIIKNKTSKTNETKNLQNKKVSFFTLHIELSRPFLWFVMNKALTHTIKGTGSR